MRVVRWMCGVKLQDRVPSKELRGRLELEDIISSALSQYVNFLCMQDDVLAKVFIFFLLFLVFTRDSIYAIARICYGNSVCLSVCPSVRLSVCLSHGWISQKRLKLGSRNFHHTVAPSL